MSLQIRSALIALSTVTIAGACQSDRRTVDVVDQVVGAWLMCIECTDGEAQALRVAAALDEHLVLRLLDSAAEHGPSAIQRENLQHQLLEAYFLIHPPDTQSAPGADWIEMYEGNVLRLYQIRAIAGVRLLDSPSADSVLTDVVRRDSAQQFLSDLARSQLGLTTP